MAGASITLLRTVPNLFLDDLFLQVSIEYFWTEVECR